MILDLLIFYCYNRIPHTGCFKKSKGLLNLRIWKLGNLRARCWHLLGAFLVLHSTAAPQSFFLFLQSHHCYHGSFILTGSKNSNYHPVVPVPNTSNISIWGIKFPTYEPFRHINANYSSTQVFNKWIFFIKIQRMDKKPMAFEHSVEMNTQVLSSFF